MKKLISVGVIAGMVLGLVVVASAAPSTYRQRVEAALAKQSPPGQITAPGLVDNGVPPQAGKAPKITDRRIITPAMDYRERVEVMRDIKKRASAMRNQLMLAAEQERQRSPQPARAGIPSVQ